MQLIPLTGTITMVNEHKILSGASDAAHTPHGDDNAPRRIFSFQKFLMQLIPLTGTITLLLRPSSRRNKGMQLIPLTGTITISYDLEEIYRIRMQLIPLTGTITAPAPDRLLPSADAAHTPHGDEIKQGMESCCFPSLVLFARQNQSSSIWSGISSQTTTVS